VVGAYPATAAYDEPRPEEIDYTDALAAIAKVKLPRQIRSMAPRTADRAVAIPFPCDGLSKRRRRAKARRPAAAARRRA
jgi:hypothetical protein